MFSHGKGAGKRGGVRSNEDEASRNSRTRLIVGKLSRVHRLGLIPLLPVRKNSDRLGVTKDWWSIFPLVFSTACVCLLWLSLYSIGASITAYKRQFLGLEARGQVLHEQSNGHSSVLPALGSILSSSS